MMFSLVSAPKAVLPSMPSFQGRSISLGTTYPSRAAALSATIQRRRVVLPQAVGGDEPEAKVVREFREDTGVESAPSQQQSGYLYADENPPPPRDNMSREMKERLRKEYLSLGGSENVAATNWALYIILAISFLAVASWLTGAL